MVKAGVVLVAVSGPALGGIGAWKGCGLAFGVASVVWGALGALRHRDAKLILAWGTVSQLGMLITLFSVGTPKAVLAAVTLLVAHALFKGALFLIVGEIDVRAGTRCIDGAGGGLARSMPVAFAAAVLAGLSMAGAPPLFRLRRQGDGRLRRARTGRPGGVDRRLRGDRRIGADRGLHVPVPGRGVRTGPGDPALSPPPCAERAVRGPRRGRHRGLRRPRAGRCRPGAGRGPG